MNSSSYSRQQKCVAVAAFIFIPLVYTASISEKDVTCEAPSVEPLVSASVICHFPEDVSQTRRIISVSINKGETSRDAAVNSSCTIASVQEMESTTLTCRYSVDMNVTRKNFTVVHLGGEYHENVDILNCNWQDEKLDCTPAPGYQFNNTVTDQLVIDVPRASRDHNGTYACHVTGSDNENFALCEFIITQGLHQGRSAISGEPMKYGSFLAVNGSSVVMLIPVSLLILFIHRWKKRSMQRMDRTSNGQTIAEGQTMLYEGPPMMRSAEDRSNECALTGTDQEMDFTDGYTAEATIELRKVPVKIRVVFHLETTGLGMNSHILRIAAASPSKRFFRYVFPRIAIEPSAEKVNKISLVKGRLCKNGQPVDALTIRQALSEFLEFFGDEFVTLFSHNCRKFSAPILFNAIKACDMLEEFKGKITGFVDTLYLFHNVYPGLRSYKQCDLYEHFFHKSYRAHEEMNDVTALEKLLDLPRVTPEALEMNSFGFDYIAQAVGSC